jgi:adenylate cyclase class 2
MMLEVELKFPVRDREAICALLAARGATFEPPQREIDQYFQHPSRDFRATDEAVRLRSIGEENRLAYKGPRLDAETKTRHEIEFSIGPGSENRARALDWLSAVGFSHVAQVAKTRALAQLAWEGREVTLSLDSVDELGEFLELEILAPPPELDAARQTLLSLAASLGLGVSERRGYLHLLLAKRETPAAPSGR